MKVSNSENKALSYSLEYKDLNSYDSKEICRTFILTLEENLSVGEKYTLECLAGIKTYSGATLDKTITSEVELDKDNTDDDDDDDDNGGNETPGDDNDENGDDNTGGSDDNNDGDGNIETDDKDNTDNDSENDQKPLPSTGHKGNTLHLGIILLLGGLLLYKKRLNTISNFF